MASSSPEQSKDNITNVKYNPASESTPILNQVVIISEEESPIIPIHPNRNNWHFSLFERSCLCGGDCFMAWFCACIPLAQIASKLKTVGNPYCLDYKGIIWTSLFVMFVDLLFSSNGGESSFFSIFIWILTFQLRQIVRTRFNIYGGCIEDVFLSFFCTPCVITQMVGQLWATPSVVPGWDVTESPAFIL